MRYSDQWAIQNIKWFVKVQNSTQSWEWWYGDLGIDNTIHDVKKWNYKQMESLLLGEMLRGATAEPACLWGPEAWSTNKKREPKSKNYKLLSVYFTVQLAWLMFTLTDISVGTPRAHMPAIQYYNRINSDWLSNWGLTVNLHQQTSVGF